jgi:hypothetical protein
VHAAAARPVERHHRDPVSEAGLPVTADPQWDRPCLGYLAQARLADDALARLVAIQVRLPDLVPVPLHLCPAWSLHVTVYGLVPPRWPDDVDKARHWAAIAPGCVAALHAIGGSGPRLVLTFDRVAVTPMAVIATARDPSGLVARLRAAFADGARHPGNPAPRYDIIHVTLARFAAAGTVPAAAAAAAALPPGGDAAVARLEIVRERVYPSLAVDELATVMLAVTP